jgi:N-acetylglucosamine malate deacetylase 1
MTGSPEARAPGPPDDAPGESGRQAPLDLLAIFAHPDDAELLCGGALALAASRGERVGILDLTRGEMGSSGTPDLRAAEAKAAAEHLGIIGRWNAGLPDGRLEDSHEARRRVAGFLRRLRPEVVVTHWIEGRHPDHRAAAALVHASTFLASLRKLEVEAPPFRPRKLIHATLFREDAPPPTFVLDVTPVIDRKMAAIRAFESQFEGKHAAGEVFPGGTRSLEDQVRAQMAYWGARIRVEYGEPYWTRETVRFPSLTEVPVSSF